MHKIAVIEDDHAIRSMYEFKLNNSGYMAKTAENGIQGFKLVESFTPDLILLDVKMPEMNGDELLEKIRQTEWGASIRVIILTNITRDEAPMSLRLLNVDRYIVKAHHTPTQVVSAVDEVLCKKAN